MEGMVNKNLFGSIYKNKKVFITGHSGFKGSWLSQWLLELGAEVIGFSLPERTSPSHYDLLGLKIKSYAGDIRDSASLAKSVADTKPDIVFHLAAQALVRDSYRDPSLTYQTNVIGTLNILEAVKNVPSVKAMINVTTDKVYDNKEWNWPYRENDSLGGYDLYSSSKACSEILTASYRSSFFNLEKYGEQHTVLIASARAGNVIGGGDWATDRLIPDVARATDKRQTVEIRHPQSVRPWEHVLEPLSGYLLLGQKLLEGKKEFATAWNFGPENTQALSVADVLSKFQKHWPEVNWKNVETEKEFHEAKILKLDCSKAWAELSWRPVWSLDDTLRYTAEWYKKFYDRNEINTLNDIENFINLASQQNHKWVSS
jgi:CDP-glucose 4,6-dehydratase